MNRKNTKRALCMSFVSLLLCCSMLVGSTFAWFTDTASTTVNSIQSGIIDIRLVDPFTGEDMEGKSLKWVANGEPADEVLWEPGVTFYSQPVRVMNYSNLSFFMEAFISGFTGDMKLMEALEFKIVHAYACLPESQGGLGLSFDQCNGRSYVYTGSGNVFTGEGKDGDKVMADSMGIQADWTNLMNDYNNDGEMEGGPGAGQPKPLYDLCIIAHMKEEAGNEYQGLTLSGAAMTFRATQANYEYDSFDNLYDKDATFPDMPAVKVTVDPAANPVSAQTITGSLGETIREKSAGATDPIVVTLGNDLTVGTDSFDTNWLNGVEYVTNKDNGYLIYVGENADVTLDLGGKTVTFGYTGGFYGACFGVEDGASLTIINGTLVFNDDIVKYAYDLGEGASFTIDDSVTVVGTVDKAE